MTRRILLSALGALTGLGNGLLYRPRYEKPTITELRWTRYESWQKHRRGMDTAFLRGVRSDGAVFTVADVSELGCYAKLRRDLNDYLAYPMARGDAFATGRACGYRA